MARACLKLIILCLIVIQTHALPAKYVTLRGLDKVTARVFDLDAEVGKTFRFGTLEIEIHTCDKTPEEEIPECKALIEVWENKPDETPKRYFSSWMFSSSPSISAMDHPVYDIWISGCKFSKDKAELKTDSENVDEIDHIERDEQYDLKQQSESVDVSENIMVEREGFEPSIRD